MAVCRTLDVSESGLGLDTARRIARGAGAGDTELVHRFVDRDAGLDALVDAVAADLLVR